MNRLFCLLLLLFNTAAFAQQDPDDPGIQDSVILGSASIDSGAAPHFVSVPIYIVTDDSVAFYYMPFTWESSIGGIHLRQPFIYYYPFNCNNWAFDTIYADQRRVEFRGLGGLDSTFCIYNTGGIRALYTNLGFIIDPDAPRQLAVIDTFWSDRDLSLMFALIDGFTDFTPAFLPGFIAIGPGVDVEDDEQVPKFFSLSQNYPNPFNPSTNIDFALADVGQVSLIVYDLLGRQVKTLLDENLMSGRFTVTWDGRDESGGDVPSGVYFYKITSAGFSESKRMILLR